MTNYNERLDEVLSGLSGKSFDAAFNNPDDYMVVLLRSGADAKQALTSLIKELVARAKPEVKAHPLGPVTIADCQRGLDHYEANLLKALEEV